jgi:hypothetical protein
MYTHFVIMVEISRSCNVFSTFIFVFVSIADKILLEELNGQTYDEEEAKVWSLNISDKIREAVFGELCMNVYRIMYIYVYVYINIYKYMYTCIFSYIYVYIYKCMYIYIYMYICKCMYIYIYIYIHTYINIYRYVCFTRLT